MSRSGLHEAEFDSREDVLAYGRFRAATHSAIRGKRGQKLLCDLRDALDAMPVKELIADKLITPQGEVCAVGCLMQARGIDKIDHIDYADFEGIAKMLGVNEKVIQEIEFLNDQGYAEWLPLPNVGYNQEFMKRDRPDERWRYLREWVDGWIKE